MTERKPPETSWETCIEAQIRVAMAKGPSTTCRGRVSGQRRRREVQRRWRSQQKTPSMRPQPQFRVAPCCRPRQPASLASRGRGVMR